MASIGDVLDKYLGKGFKFLGTIFRIIKFIFILIGFSIFMYICFLIFGYLFFVGAFLCTPPALALFNKILEVPSKHVWECRIGSEENKKEDRLGLIKIPNKLFEVFNKEGSNFSIMESVKGVSVILAEEVDTEKKIIKKAWTNEVRSIEFYGRKEAFFDLQQKFISIIRKVIVLLANWKIYNALEIKSIYEDIDYTTDLKEIEERFKDKTPGNIIEGKKDDKQ